MNWRKKQKGLIEFQEKYKSQNSIQLETEKKILTNDYELFFGLYSDIVKQRERARIQVKEDMPVLTVIEPVVEPTVPSKPHRALIIVASAMIGLFLGCGTVLIQPFLAEIVSTKKSTPTIPIDGGKKFPDEVKCQKLKNSFLNLFIYLIFVPIYPSVFVISPAIIYCN